MPGLIIGVDGGGTSTRCVVADETGEVLGRGRAGGANPHSVKNPSANLLAALRAALDGLDSSRVIGGVFGLAGIGPAETVAMEAWRAAGLPGHPSVVPDLLVAFAGATAEPYGTVLVAGTGAVGARIQDRRIVRRADGRGWLLGDEGSGTWIGRQALTRVLAALDGRARPMALVDRVVSALRGETAHLSAAGTAAGTADETADEAAAAAAATPIDPGIPGDIAGDDLAEAIVSVAYARVADRGPAWLATLAPVVDEAARLGDPVARDILDEAAGRLARTVRAVGGGEGPLVLAGSLLTEPTELARRVRAELAELGGHMVPARDGAAGAAALALHAALPPDDVRALQGHRRLIGSQAGR